MQGRVEREEGWPYSRRHITWAVEWKENLDFTVNGGGVGWGTIGGFGTAK